MSVQSKLEIVLQATTDAFDRKLKNAMTGLDGFAKKCADIQNGMDRFARKNKKSLESMRTIGKNAVYGMTALGVAVTSSTKSAIAFEKSMASVKKVVDFPTPQAFKQMEKDILAMSQRLPITAEGLADIMAEAGQAGIAVSDLKRFTETAGKMGIAFDISAQQAGQALAQMRVAFNLSQSEVETLADKINYLGNTTPNTADKIMEVVQRIGSLGTIAGVSSDQIAVLAGSITAVEPDVAATGIKNMMLALTRGSQATTSQAKAFNALGLSATQVAKSMQEDSMGVLFDVIERIQALPKDLQVPTINSIFGSEALPVISQLVANSDLLKKNLQAVSDVGLYANSMQKEFDSMAGTSANQMQLFAQNIEAVKIALGSALLPALTAVVESITPFLQSLADFASENPKLVSQLALASGAFLAVGLAIGAVGFAVPALVSGFGAIFSVVLAVTTGFGALSGVFTLIAPAIVATGTALVAFVAPFASVIAVVAALSTALVLLYKNLDGIVGGYNAFKNTVSESFEALKNNVITKLNELDAHVNSIIGKMPAPIRLALTTILTLFDTSFALIKTAIATAFNAIKALVRGDMDGVNKAIGDGLRNAWGITKAGIGNIIKEFTNLGGRFRQAGHDAIQGFLNGIQSQMKKAYQSAQQMASTVVNAVKQALVIRSPSRVMRQLGEWAGEGFVLGLEDKAEDAKAVAESLAGALTQTLSNLHREGFLLTNHADPLADLQYKLQFGELAELTDKQKQRLLQLAQINLDIQKANESVAQSLRQQEQSAQNIADANERSVQNYQSLQKQIALFDNQSKVVEFDYDWAQGDFADTDQMLLLRQRDALVRYESLVKAKESLSDFTNMQNNLHSELVGEDAHGALKAKLDERLRIIRAYENEHANVESQAQMARQMATSAYLQAQNELYFERTTNLFGSLTQIAKDGFGEQSRIYRAIFAMEKGFAIARSIIAIQSAIAQAAANPFPMNLGAMAAVASQTASIIGNIRAIAMPIGQAHDGIMSVPQSGTWNLQKGERVLPKHTAKALDDKLLSMGEHDRTAQNIAINVTVNQESIDIQSQQRFGKDLASAIATAIQAELRKQKRQGGMLYAG